MRAVLRLAYDGTDFAGCSPLPGERTVVGELVPALSRVPLPPTFAETLSRTDAGVHARGNLGHVVLPRSVDPADLLRILDRHLPDDLRCVEVIPVNAPPVAAEKTYRYQLDRSPFGDPHRARTWWRVPGALDEAALHRLAAASVGTHDFEAFRRSGETREDLTRTLAAVTWDTVPDGLVCEVRGQGFPYRLVRSLVGGMVMVARGSASEEDFLAALAGGAGPASRQTAPARGLWLMGIALSG